MIFQIVDDGPECSLAFLRPGLFRLGSAVGLKTEYQMIIGTDAGRGKVEWKVSQWPEAYVAASGECWWGGGKTHEERAAIMVQPVRVAYAPSPTPP